MKTDREKIELARQQLLQAAVELDEAAKIIEGRNLPNVASLFSIAADQKRATANEMFDSLLGREPTVGGVSL